MLCDSPLRMMHGGLEVVVACRECKQCRAARRRDVVGRSLAESRQAKATTFVTLTYGHDARYSQRVDHPHANKLEYSDIQKWIKRIRARQIPGSKERYRVRYLVAGEYGPKKGRAHWHVILWWYNAVPEYSTERRWSDDPFWSEGFTQWAGVKDGDSRAVAYVAKYVSKDGVADDVQTVVHASYRPLVGGEFFRQWAEMHVEAGLPLRQGRKYQLAGVYSRKGRLFDYWMSDAAARLVARCYIEAWAEKYGTHPPYSRIVEKYEDEEARDRVEDLRDDAAIERVRVGGYVSSAARSASSPTKGPPSGYEAWWDEHVMAFVAFTGDGRPGLFWNEKAGVWARSIEARKVRLSDISSPLGCGNDPLPDLPGEAPREFRRAADVPDFVPGEAIYIGKRRAGLNRQGRRLALAQDQYHSAMVEKRMARVADAIRRFRESDPE